ncbi:MAG: aspartate-semialdehyde dehydrogenase [Holosporales bacterium]|jgi:aspartate-semialdehyde dehydrogenase|nr:aspartate-semialdehyde dehydrogenase [Holosporales bacterium]
MKKKRFVVVGATGRVGREMLSILLEHGVSSDNVTAIASPRSAGTEIMYGATSLVVSTLDEVDFQQFDIALFSAGRDVAARYAPIASSAGCTVVDNSSCFRNDDDIALVVPEINLEDIQRAKNKRIIANPNCSTIQAVMVLKPLHDAFGLKELVMSTYQATSGAGQRAVDELLEQSRDVLAGKEAYPRHFKRQIAFNVIPQIDDFSDSGYTKEELKMMNETRKILGVSDIDITATCVRVPVMVGHAVSVFARFVDDVDLDKAIGVISEFNGVKVVDDNATYRYATPLDVAGADDVFVSRLRKHPTFKNAISFWCVCDNLRKGAALNAVQIAAKLDDL